MRWTYLIRWGMRISRREPAIKRRNSQSLRSLSPHHPFEFVLTSACRAGLVSTLGTWQVVLDGRRWGTAFHELVLRCNDLAALPFCSPSYYATNCCCTSAHFAFAVTLAFSCFDLPCLFCPGIGGRDVNLWASRCDGLALQRLLESWSFPICSVVGFVFFGAFAFLGFLCGFWARALPLYACRLLRSTLSFRLLDLPLLLCRSVLSFS